ncbi:hypothetical protein NLX71_03990 [Paenibacillus sp. MZ04-78.2]|uniref:hypothetical protein n=1 Tax=Paenibacillus sp. MZ04-78.2 TaxID=2962034 RepID=UPI0020B837DD|nr:hypothetical protein [Paenibacillus sp. MZ04-78.2]MCP3772478.1 hypothetical protein [Paenibacillus sp. MZ04-78.2]
MNTKNQNEADGRYEELFLQFAHRAERWISWALAGCAIALVFSQLLLLNPRIRYALVKVEQLEGLPYSISLLRTTEGK